MPATRTKNRFLDLPSLAAVGRLLALPIEVSYTLPEMLQALGSSFQYTRRDYYHFPLGHGLRAEALHAAWYRGETGNVDRKSVV